MEGSPSNQAHTVNALNLLNEQDDTWLISRAPESINRLPSVTHEDLETSEQLSVHQTSTEAVDHQVATGAACSDEPLGSNDQPVLKAFGDLSQSGADDEPLQPLQFQGLLANPTITTQIAPAIQPDLDIDDEGYPESVATSYVSSIASEISRGIIENERLYPQYGQHSYGMPVDEEEMDRMDLQHRKYELVIGDRHFLAPIGDCPGKILDLGTGTGIWALDVADMFPTAQVVGVDIAPIQPRWVAPNCQFEIDDIEATWTYQPNSFDFIHMRDPLYVVRDWPKLIQQCYEHVKPGGWCELACIYPLPMSDDGSMPDNSGFKVMCEKLIEGSTLFGTPADCPLSFASYLRDGGFVDVSENIFKVPSSPWPKDKRLKKIGALEMVNVIAGANAFGLRAFEKVFGYTKEQTEIAMIEFQRDVKNRKYHQYCPYYVVYGRKLPDYLDATYV